MTPEELVNRCIMPTFAGTTPPDWLLREISRGVSAVCLFGRHFGGGAGEAGGTGGGGAGEAGSAGGGRAGEAGSAGRTEKIRALTARLRTDAPDLLIAADEEGGDVTRIDAAVGSPFPGNAVLGVVDDVETTRDIATAMGRRLASLGVNCDLAPCADVNSNPQNPVIGIRSFGADSALVARHTAAFVYGMQQVGVAACAKHFPGHGDTSTDSHVAVPHIDVDMDGLRAIELPPFHAAVGVRVKAIMVGHILIPTIDKQPATVSRAAISLLRGEVGFDGVVISDALDMAAVANMYGMAEAGVRALEAGVDLLCIGSIGREDEFISLRDAIVEAVRSGRLMENRLVEAGERVRALCSWAWGYEHPIATDSQDWDLGLETARRAIHATGDVQLDSPALVREFHTPGSIAAGEVPWSLYKEMRALDSQGGHVEWQTGQTSSKLPLVEGSFPLVVVYRDAHLHPEIAAEVQTIVTDNPRAICVALGGRGDRVFTSNTIRTFGSSPVCTRAAAEILTGRVQ